MVGNVWSSRVCYSVGFLCVCVHIYSHPLWQQVSWSGPQQEHELGRSHFVKDRKQPGEGAAAAPQRRCRRLKTGKGQQDGEEQVKTKDEMVGWPATVSGRRGRETGIDRDIVYVLSL